MSDPLLAGVATFLATVLSAFAKVVLAVSTTDREVTVGIVSFIVAAVCWGVVAFAVVSAL